MNNLCIEKIKSNEKYFKKSDWKIEQNKIIGTTEINNNKINYEILANAEQNKFDRVFELIRKGGDVNATSYFPYNDTPIMYAIKKSDSNTVKRLIMMGADLEIIKNYETGDTILIDAIYSLRFNETTFEIVKTIAKKCDINKPNKKGTTPLMIASGMIRDVKVIEMLIEMGADINAINNDGVDALTFAVRSREKEKIKKLIELGADKKNVLNDYETLHSLYEDCCEKEIVNLINDTIKINNKKKSEIFENFIDFVRLNEMDKVKNIIERIDINEKDENNWTALMHAIIEGNFEVVKILIENDADLNISDEEGWTPLMLAIKENRYDIIEELVNNKADVNSKNNYGLTAIMLASNYGQEEIVKLLIENKANVYEKDNNDNTVLKYANQSKSDKIIEIIINSL